jgi:hypothetical protein
VEGETMHFAVEGTIAEIVAGALRDAGYPGESLLIEHRGWSETHVQFENETIFVDVIFAGTIVEVLPTETADPYGEMLDLADPRSLEQLWTILRRMFANLPAKAPWDVIDLFGQTLTTKPYS